mgnify:CR=1 FL=1
MSKNPTPENEVVDRGHVGLRERTVAGVKWTQKPVSKDNGRLKGITDIPEVESWKAAVAFHGGDEAKALELVNFGLDVRYARKARNELSEPSETSEAKSLKSEIEVLAAEAGLSLGEYVAALRAKA